MKDKELAVNVFCYIEEHKGPSTFNVVVLVRPGKDLKEVEKAVYAELDKREIRARRRLGIAEGPHDGAPSKPRRSCRARCTAPTSSARWR